MISTRSKIPPCLAVAMALGLQLATLRGADEFELVDSTFSPVVSAAGGDFSVAFQPVESFSISEPLTGGEFVSEGPELIPPPADESALPALVLELGGDGVVRLAWGIEAAGAVLESSEDLLAWRAEAPVLEGAGTRSVQPSAGARFFRLRR